MLALWNLSDRLCSKRLKEMTPLLLSAPIRHGVVEDREELRQLLLRISPATIERLLCDARIAVQSRRLRRAGMSQRSVARFLSAPSTTGTMQSRDLSRLVAHGGTSVAGSFIQTLVLSAYPRSQAMRSRMSTTRSPGSVKSNSLAGHSRVQSSLGCRPSSRHLVSFTHIAPTLTASIITSLNRTISATRQEGWLRRRAPPTPWRSPERTIDQKQAPRTIGESRRLTRFEPRLAHNVGHTAGSQWQDKGPQGRDCSSHKAAMIRH